MWRLWNSLTKGVRCSVASANSTSPNSLPLADGEKLNSSLFPHPSGNFTGRTSHRRQSKDDSYRGQQHTSQFRWTNIGGCSHKFLEICGLSTSVVLGWQFVQLKLQHRRGRDRPVAALDKFNPIETLCSIALAQPAAFRTTFNVNRVERRPLHSSSTNSKGDKAGETSETPKPKLSIKEEINQTMAKLSADLNGSYNSRMAEWQNSVGVDLLSASSKGSVSSYDNLIAAPNEDRATTYKREAFMCFEESKKLGSVKGMFNLGLCYEQGIGTRVDLEKAVECYEEAASRGHSGAQYNLGLLHYYGKVHPTSDDSKAISLISQAARQGLEQAWSALLSILHAKADERNWSHGSTWSLCVAQDLNEELGTATRNSNFRKTHSEPHDFNTNVAQADPGKQLPAGDGSNGSVFFYLG